MALNSERMKDLNDAGLDVAATDTKTVVVEFRSPSTRTETDRPSRVQRFYVSRDTLQLLSEMSPQQARKLAHFAGELVNALTFGRDHE